MKKKPLLITADNNFFSYVDGKYYSVLINETFPNIKKYIIRIGKNRNPQLIKKINLINICKGFFLLKKKLIVINDLSILFKSEDLRSDLNSKGKVFVRNYYWTIIRSFIVILNFYEYFQKITNKYSELCTLCYYNSTNLAALTAFKLANKKTYELQHGSIYNHQAYPISNLRYYKKSNILKPDALILWKNEKKLFFKEVEILHTAYPYASINKKKKKTIIGYSLSGWEYTKKFEMNKKIISLIKKYSDINWSFRFHPMRNNIKYYEKSIFYKQIYKCKNVKFVNCKTDLKIWLSTLAIHMSDTSSSFLEAAALGIKSFSFNNNVKLYFKELLDKKDLEIINNKNYEKKIINEFLKNNNR